MEARIDVRQSMPGFVLALVVGLSAYAIGGMHKALDPLVVGIVLGMVVRIGMGDRALFRQGLKIVPKIFIPIGIVVYGVNLRFHKLNIIPLTTWMQILIGIAIVFFLGMWMGKKLSLPRATTILVSIGTAICGASAIAIATPVIEGESEDAGVSLLTITVWGMAGLLLFPFFQSRLAMSSENYGILCATTLHQTGLVKMAALQMGEECMKSAMIIKMARMSMLLPILAVFSLLKKKGAARKGVGLQIPWFLWGFILTGLLFSFVPFLQPSIPYVKPFGTALWAIAMTSLGLSVDMRKILRGIVKPLILGLVVWAAIVANFFVGYYGMGY